MRARDLKTFSAEDSEVARLQSALVEAFEPLLKSPFASAVLLPVVTINTTPTQVAHKLGRPLQSWLLAGPTADARVWEIARTSTMLTLQASAEIKTQLVVF